MGLLLWIVWIRSFFVLYGVDGYMIFSFGMCVNNDVSICECCVVVCRLVLYIVWIMIGVMVLLLNM